MNNKFLIQWNVNGYFTRLTEIKLLINETDPYVICLQETHLKNNSCPQILGYATYTTNNLSNRARGGVLTAIKNTINHNYLDLNTTLEAIAIRVTFPTVFTICNIYLSPSNIINFNEMKLLIDQLETPFILLGDFNAHSTLWGSQNDNARGIIISDLIDHFHLNIFNTGLSTYLSPSYNTFSCIDLTLGTSSLISKFDWNTIEDLHGSDHFPISLDILINKTQRTKRAKWVLKHADWPLFSNSVEINYKENSERDIDSSASVETFTNTLYEAAISSIPRTSEITKRVPVPWWTNDIKVAIRNRQKALKTFKRCPNEQNLVQFKKCRAKSRFLIKKGRKSSWESFVQSISTTTPIQTIFNKINRISGLSKIVNQPIIIENNISYTDPVDVANIMCKTFQRHNSSENYPNNFILKRAQIQTNYNINENHELSYNHDFELHELECALSKCKGTSPGPDEICYEMVKNLTLKNRLQLLNIYNSIWNKGDFPTEWKTALVIPISKPNSNPNEASSFRPISLTSCLCKLIERMINRRLLFFLENGSHLHKNQSGFRKGMSTADHQITLENEIYHAFLKKHHVGAVFFDINKAYDRVCSKTLLNKLCSIGIRGKLLIFIKNFISNRKIQVTIGNSKSDKLLLENGLPQGSVLSVTLFLCYINNILNSIRYPIHGLLYADDLAIFYSNKNIKTIERKLQIALNQLSKWSLDNGMSFSERKTKSLLFTRTFKDYLPPKLYLNNIEIETVQSYKFLGLYFDKKMSWQINIENLVKSCNIRFKALKMIAYKNWGTDQNTLLMLYKSLILSKLDYGSSLYSSCRPALLRKIEKVHNDGIRLCIGAFKSTPIKSLLNIVNITSLEDRREYILTKTAADILSKPYHPTKIHYKDDQLIKLYETKVRSSKPFAYRALKILNEINIKISEINFQQNNYIFKLNPPWKNDCLKIDLSLARYKKENTVPQVYYQLFLEFQSNNPEYIYIYTDASKSGDRSGFSVVDPKNFFLKMASVPKQFSIFNAELFAILDAVKYINKISRRDQQFIICTDSLSAVQELQRYTENYLAVEIFKYVGRNKNICFKWIPGHSNIPGNEIADEVAKSASEIMVTTNILVDRKDFKSYLKMKFLNKWSLQWTNIQNNKLRDIKPSMDPWTFSNEFTRKEASTITRLRLGHTNLTHSFLMAKEPSPVCLDCRLPLTVKHILIECKKYDTLKNKLQLNIPLNEMLNPQNNLKLKQFLIESELINKI